MKYIIDIRVWEGGKLAEKFETGERSKLLELADKKILLCTSRRTIYFQQPHMELSINHEIKSKQLKTVISKTFCCQFLQWIRNYN